jgi:hypothetical protein
VIVASDSVPESTGAENSGAGSLISPAAIDLPATYGVDITDFVTWALSLGAR